MKVLQTEKTFTMEEVKIKIEKLMKLSESPNENEAAMAMAKANQLMADYNLSISEIILDESKPMSAIRDEVGEDLDDWELSLANKVSMIFGVKMFQTTKKVAIRYRYSSKKSIVFYGLPMDVEATKATYLMLNQAIKSISTIEFLKAKMMGLIGNHRGETLAFKRGWFLGCVQRITERVKEQRNYEMSQNVTMTALVIRKKDLINEAMQKDGVRLGKSQASTARTDSQAILMGRNAANSITLNKQVN